MLKSIYHKIKNQIQIMNYKKKWKIGNKHNETSVTGTFDIEKVQVGQKTYGRIHAVDFGNGKEKLVIGSYCSIAENVTFLLGGEHDYKNIMTYPLKVKLMQEKNESITKGVIVVEDDVWIGYGATILSGVKIGQGAVIGAGSIVSKDIPPYAIYAGGKIVKYRFSEKIIKQLLKIDYSKLEEKTILDNLNDFYTEITEENDEVVINKFLS